MRVIPWIGAALAAIALTGAGKPEEVAVFAGGCFWGVESVFEHVRGVRIAESGYAGGTLASPSYEQVSTGTTGHAESVRVVFDPSVVSYRQLLEIFFAVAHDPTTRDRQGPDSGTEYRAIVFYQTEAQHQAAEGYIRELTASKRFHAPIVTEVKALTAFYLAEAYHQDYAAHHPDQGYIVVNDQPKVEHLHRDFPALFRALPTD